ncbi:class I SAM-dependent methyltransferase [Sphingosinicella sp. YJ22]|uniref:SAM-dependent methyltransferase n=1 Tax=Sphingosinicella sp. YJ22 TaxID=1104780 RepID=UPI001A9C491C|nr:class I SAM-dependent methyltransferase [Sphingosinicella sp. YJ22]
MTMQITRRAALGLVTGGLAAPAFAQRRRELDVPFVPTPHSLVEQMLDLAGVTAEDYLVDLGCGDGRIAVAAGQRGARALGVDIEALRIQEAAAAARVAGVEGRVRFRRQDLFATPIHEASVVAIYLLPDINLRLRPKLLTELPAGARVVSHAFDMGDWAADAEEVHDGRRIFLWHVPAVAGGSWEVTATDGSYRLLELEQRFQEVAGTLSGDGTVRAVVGRLRGRHLVLSAQDDGAPLALSGTIDGADFLPDAAARSGQGGWTGRRIA